LNVSGLKRRLIFPEITDLIRNNDIVCLTETHTENSDIIQFPDYSYLANHKKQAVLRKSGGIGVFIKNSLMPYVEHVNTQNEYVLWLKISKILTKLDEDMVLGVLLVPPEKSRFFNDEEFCKLEREIGSYSQNHKYLMLSGDVNARTAKLKDYIEPDSFLNELFDIDNGAHTDLNKLTVLKQLNIPTQRYSKDSKTTQMA